MNELKSIFETYRTAVFAKDAPTFLSLYHPEFRGFDMWEEWLKTPESWQRMVNEWFSSLQSERVQVEFSEIREIATAEIATADAIARYTAISSNGEYLRHLENRLTWVAKKENGSWKIIHEHTSAPISSETGKALLQRA